MAMLQPTKPDGGIPPGVSDSLRRMDAWAGLRAMGTWGARRWWVALAGAVATALAIGLPTDVIPNPIFGREIPPTWWSIPVLAVTSALSGLLLATYVTVGAVKAQPETDAQAEADVPRSERGGAVAGGLLAMFAVGCPVCNKVVLIALGTSGAMNWFAPVQPILAVASIALLAYALRARLAGLVACPTPR